jgi:hypothetical protein
MKPEAGSNADARHLWITRQIKSNDWLKLRQAIKAPNEAMREQRDWLGR